MIYDYAITTVFTSDSARKGSTITRVICIKATMAEIGDILRALISSPKVLSCSVERSVTIPTLAIIGKLSYKECGITEHESTKFKNE